MIRFFFCLPISTWHVHLRLSDSNPYYSFFVFFLCFSDNRISITFLISLPLFWVCYKLLQSIFYFLVFIFIRNNFFVIFFFFLFFFLCIIFLYCLMPSIIDLFIFIFSFIHWWFIQFIHFLHNSSLIKHVIHLSYIYIHSLFIQSFFYSKINLFSHFILYNYLFLASFIHYSFSYFLLHLFIIDLYIHLDIFFLLVHLFIYLFY